MVSETNVTPPGKGGDLPGTKGKDRIPPGFYRPKTSNKEFFGTAESRRRMSEKGTAPLQKMKRVRKSK